MSQPAQTIFSPTTPISAGVDMPPSLPMANFVSTQRWDEERMGALVMYCSDGRWNESFDEFCHRSLMIPRYDRYSLPGGPGFLAAVVREAGRDAATAAVAKNAREQLDYLVNAHGIKRIVLITHYGCGFYFERLKQPPAACLTEQFKDALELAQEMKQWYGAVDVECYLAMRRETQLSFHRLGEAAAAAVQAAVAVAIAAPEPEKSKPAPTKSTTPVRSAPPPIIAPGPRITIPQRREKWTDQT